MPRSFRSEKQQPAGLTPNESKGLGEMESLLRAIEGVGAPPPDASLACRSVRATVMHSESNALLVVLRAPTPASSRPASSRGQPGHADPPRAGTAFGDAEPMVIVPARGVFVCGLPLAGANLQHVLPPGLDLPVYITERDEQHWRDCSNPQLREDISKAIYISALWFIKPRFDSVAIQLMAIAIFCSDNKVSDAACYELAKRFIRFGNKGILKSKETLPDAANVQEGRKEEGNFSKRKQRDDEEEKFLAKVRAELETLGTEEFMRKQMANVAIYTLGENLLVTQEQMMKVLCENVTTASMHNSLASRALRVMKAAAERFLDKECVGLSVTNLLLHPRRDLLVSTVHSFSEAAARALELMPSEAAAEDLEDIQLPPAMTASTSSDGNRDSPSASDNVIPEPSLKDMKENLQLQEQGQQELKSEAEEIGQQQVKDQSQDKQELKSEAEEIGQQQVKDQSQDKQELKSEAEEIGQQQVKDQSQDKQELKSEPEEIGQQQVKDQSQDMQELKSEPKEIGQRQVKDQSQDNGQQKEKQQLPKQALQQLKGQLEEKGQQHDQGPQQLNEEPKGREEQQGKGHTQMKGQKKGNNKPQKKVQPQGKGQPQKIEQQKRKYQPQEKRQYHEKNMQNKKGKPYVNEKPVEKPGEKGQGNDEWQKDKKMRPNEKETPAEKEYSDVNEQLSQRKLNEQSEHQDQNEPPQQYQLAMDNDMLLNEQQLQLQSGEHLLEDYSPLDFEYLLRLEKYKSYLRYTDLNSPKLERNHLEELRLLFPSLLIQEKHSVSLPEDPMYEIKCSATQQHAQSLLKQINGPSKKKRKEQLQKGGYLNPFNKEVVITTLKDASTQTMKR